MNNGKICVSICVGTANEMLEQIRRAEDLADVIEIRLDCIEPKQIHKAIAFLASKKPLLLTYRPKEQGGKADIDLFQREIFWNAFIINGLNDVKKLWFDYEYDLTNLQKVSNPVTIRSFHDFSGIPENLVKIYENLSADSEIAKIAVQTYDITDAIPIWKLLERAKSENKQIIPIAMGEAGKWTRILGLAHGAFMTYASLESGSETAPGQVSVTDLIEVYRVRELDEQTEIYGIIGGNTSYSVSPFMHNAAFKSANLNSVFVPLQVNNLNEFIARMVKPATREIELNFKGFSVTIPHKQAIIKHLDFIDETAQNIGAVNTVKIENGKLYGYNTDARGFIEPLRNSYGDLKNAKVAIFGAGGAARACIFALTQENAEVTIFARNIEKAESLANEFKVQSSKFKVHDYSEFDILVNATPLGTKGNAENQTVAVAEQIKNLHLVYDLVYNPFETRFLREANRVGVPTIGGLAMLVAQGAAQFKIWTGKDAPIKEMSATALRKLG